MRKKPIANLAASVQSRLLNLSRERGEDFNLLLRRYAIERLLYRLSQSAYREQFVLKGAMLFVVWAGQIYRPTRDLDLLAYGDTSPEKLINIFRDLSQIEIEQDGLTFDSASLAAEAIREGQKYHGWRVRMMVLLGVVRIPVQVDVGFGDVITPAPIEVEYPTLLDFTTPHLFAYTKETVIAEKFLAMVTLGIANSRIKDFYDIWMMAATFTFEGSLLARAITATFQRQNTPLPKDIPIALTAQFAESMDKQRQWQAFIQRNRLNAPAAFAEVIQALRSFLLPLLTALNNRAAFEQSWPFGGPWTKHANEERVCP